MWTLNAADPHVILMKAERRWDREGEAQVGGRGLPAPLPCSGPYSRTTKYHPTVILIDFLVWVIYSLKER